jgi:hypothetical protein
MIESQRKKAARLGANGLLLGEFVEASTAAKVAKVVVGAPASSRSSAVAIFIPENPREYAKPARHQKRVKASVWPSPSIVFLTNIGAARLALSAQEVPHSPRLIDRSFLLVTVLLCASAPERSQTTDVPDGALVIRGVWLFVALRDAVAATVASCSSPERTSRLMPDLRVPRFHTRSEVEDSEVLVRVCVANSLASGAPRRSGASFNA